MEKFWQFFSSNFGTKAISVIIAVVLWIVVLGSRNVEVTKEVPLEIITTADTVVANDIPDKIGFRLSGPKAFLRAILDRREDPIRVNLSGTKPGLVTYRFFADNIRVPIGVKVLSINPTAVLIKLEPIKTRDVPVRVEMTGVPPEGFRIARVSIKPEVVKIKGPETRIDAITEVATQPIDVSQLTEDLDREVSLDLSRYNVKLEGALPKVQIELDASSANYKIKNVDIRVLSSHSVKLSEQTVNVLVRAAPGDLKALDRSRVYGLIDMRGKPKGKYTEKVTVTLPRNIGIAKVIPETVTVTLY